MQWEKCVQPDACAARSAFCAKLREPRAPRLFIAPEMCRHRSSGPVANNMLLASFLSALPFGMEVVVCSKLT